jgi:RNA polymerase sigma-70 factor (ECF subfamily)
MIENDDEALVAGYLETRDEAQFRALVERYQERVFRLVSSVLGPFRDCDAEEATQDVFLRVHEKLGQFRGSAKFGTWLYRVAYSVAINRSRAARFRLPHVELPSLVAPDDPYRDLAANERAAIVAAAVESLPEVYRTTVYLHYWNDTPLDEIAELLGAPVGTIKSYLFRARERLARALETMK